MKKLLTSVILFVTASLLFFSCKQSADLAITKRHYRSGYYVERNRSVQLEPKVQEAKVSKQIKTEQPVQTAQQTPRENDSKQAVASKTEKVTVKKANIIAALHSIKNSAANPFKTIASDEVIVKSQVENKNMLSQKVIMARSSGGGHSIVWVIIVVLLLLWVLSYLMGGWGLGSGLLSLLLVIAVVLLILKLLGVF
jgi:flagellar biosynthesis GTPase FlhF